MHFRGGLTRAIVEAHPILRPAVALGARKLLAFHSHPTGDAEPSDNDFDFTYLLDFAAAEIGLKLVDHWVIAGPNNGDRSWGNDSRRINKTEVGRHP